MNFAGLAGDDEHTAVDGPYSRLMKTRKWLVISSGMAAVAIFRLYDADAVHKLIRVAEIPYWLFANAILSGLIYLSLQYILLTYQLLVSYDLTLSERFAFRRADDLAKARDAFKVAARAVEEARADTYTGSDEMPSHRAASQGRRTLERRLQRAKEQLTELSLERRQDAKNLDPGAAWAPMDEAVEDAADLVREFQTELDEWNSRQNEILEREKARSQHVAALVAAANAASEEFRDLNRQDPSSRGFYRHAEIAIDVIRLGPAFGVAVLASLNLVIAVHGESLTRLFNH